MADSQEQGEKPRKGNWGKAPVAPTTLPFLLILLPLLQNSVFLISYPTPNSPPNKLPNSGEHSPIFLLLLLNDPPQYGFWGLKYSWSEISLTLEIPPSEGT